MLMVDYCLNIYVDKLIYSFLVPSNADKFGFAFARAIRFNFKEHIRLSTWIESKMFGSPPDDGMNLFKIICVFFLIYFCRKRSKLGTCINNI